jgi:2-polyprenyl-6-methoxyphenol hydroxylase-like FAD-dependent oxidoreductase
VAAALFLHRAGFRVDIYDQAAEFKEVGGTIGIDSHSFGILKDWDVQDAIADAHGPHYLMEVDVARVLQQLDDASRSPTCTGDTGR